MKILWLINIPLPEASYLINENPSPFGGWLINSANLISNLKDIELSVAFPHKKSNEHKELRGERIHYYSFPPIKVKDKQAKENNEQLEEILKLSKPDLVHIYGTELSHSLAMVNMCKKMNIKTVVSVQGLVSVISNHMNASLPFSAIYGKTFRNFLRRDNVSGLKKMFLTRGYDEIKTLENIENVIGRTKWDRVCTTQINPSLNYYHCNETLRGEFYNHSWDLEHCEKYSIFLSQGQYSIKGFHYMLEAMPIILKKFPNSKIYISGKNIVKRDSVKDKILFTYYGKYIQRLIKEKKLEKNVIFTGVLNEKEMCERFLKSHVFVSPSTIENESNSLSEAKILGVPSVASYVGGVTDRIIHNFDGFTYQHDAPYMLANYICEIFENNDLALKLSANAKKSALAVHDETKNLKNIIKIYQEILS